MYNFPQLSLSTQTEMTGEMRRIFGANNGTCMALAYKTIASFIRAKNSVDLFLALTHIQMLHLYVMTFTRHSCHFTEFQLFHYFHRII